MTLRGERYPTENEFRLLFEANPQPTLVFDEETLRFLAVNRAAVSQYGYTRDALLSMTVAEIAAGEEQEHPGDLVHRAVHRTRDGELIRVEVSSAAIEYEGRAARIVTTKDVTRETLVETELRASEQRFRGLVELASDMIYRADLQGRFTYVNPVATGVIGLPEEVLIGTSYLDLIREDAREETAAFYEGQIRERVPTTYYEFPVVAADGRELWIGQNVQLVFDGDDPVGVQAVARNITAHREVERLKDELIAVISHELRTPLTAMRGALGLLASGNLGQLEEKGQRMLEIAAQNADRLVRLINDILDVERMAAGRSPLVRRLVDVSTLMEDAVATMRPMAERSGIQIVLTPLQVQLNLDPDRIVQALTNLLSNAIKFSPYGGVVWVDGEVGEDAVTIRVHDEGRGIPADKLEVIFERFQQADSSDARQMGGSGLGLTISRGIVEEHGGRIRVESVPGDGASFYISLPRQASADE
jgi:PAS domain S-box-containing protein